MANIVNIVHPGKLTFWTHKNEGLVQMIFLFKRGDFQVPCQFSGGVPIFESQMAAIRLPDRIPIIHSLDM